MRTAAEPLPVHDDHTIALARSGDATAFGDIVRRHQGMVFSLAVHMLRSRAAAEDLAQDVFLALYRNLQHLESSAHVMWWLRRVTSRRCIDELRRARHRMELPMDDVPDRGTPPPRPREVFLEGRLQRLVGGLPPGARMVIVLRYQEELEPSEIADTLDMPVNTVKSHLRRSLAVLRAGLLREE
jgi:RNA polymerase sigma-70 factor, ECF subfamily